MSLEDSGFVRADLAQADAPLGAAQYSFFGDLGGGNDELEGALEEGLEVPPEEDSLEPDLVLDADEDLSYASMFASALGRREDSRPAAQAPSTRPSLLLDTLPEPSPPPSKPKLGSIALGGLLAASTPTEAAFSGGLTSTGGSFLGGPSAFAPSPQPMQPPASSPSGRPLTAQELEAQLLGGFSGGAMSMPPLQLQPPQMALPPMQHFMPPYPGAMQLGHPPPGPYLQQQPPPGFPGYLGGPPMPPPRPQPGMFTPEMIMQQQRQQQQAQQQQQQHLQQQQRPAMPMPPPPVMGSGPNLLMRPPPPPLPLGGGMPRPPPPGPGPHHRPAMGYPRPPPGMQPPPPATHGRPPPPPPSNLAQRLRALNLVDRREPERAPPPSSRRRLASKLMSQEEVESILYMQWRPLHQGSPYIEDYYYQAFVFKHYGRRNRRTFCPESVRELAPTERVAPDEVAFVKLEGLGKMAFSNIRRPRPLMAVSPEDLKAAATSEEAGEQAGAAAPARRLEQEPMLAARIMIEDCMALILDVQDLDRIFVATGGVVENEAALRQRRTLLMDGLAASLRLPAAPTAAAAAAAPAPGSTPALGDGVFMRLMALPKGKTLAAKALRQLYPPAEEQGHGGKAPPPPPQPNLRILWALLRNLRSLFSGLPTPGQGSKTGAASAADQVATAAKVAAAAADVLKRLHSPRAVCDALAAITAGDLDGAAQMDVDPEAALVPLFAPGEAAVDSRFPWLADALAALLQRAAEFELSTATPAAGKGGAAGEEQDIVGEWRRQFGQLYAVLLRHASALQEVLAAARAEGDAESAEEVRKLMPVALLRSLLPHCSATQEEELRALLTSVTA